MAATEGVCYVPCCICGGEAVGVAGDVRDRSTASQPFCRGCARGGLTDIPRYGAYLVRMLRYIAPIGWVRVGDMLGNPPWFQNLQAARHTLAVGMMHDLIRQRTDEYGGRVSLTPWGVYVAKYAMTVVPTHLAPSRREAG